MAGKFIKTTYNETVSSLVDGNNQRLNNPFYQYTDKKPTIVTFYNVNATNTTTDEGSEQMYSYTDADSPIRFDKIIGAYLFGMPRVETNLQLEEFGLESDTIEGEAYIPPGTFTPYDQSYFTIDYVHDDRMIFKVTSVTMDTFQNNGNWWKIEYRLSMADADHDRLENQVVRTYRMLIDNIGTESKCVLEEDTYSLIEDLEDRLTTMKNYYQELFFKNRLQTFTYEYDGRNFYDPYMIEFLKRNYILSGSDKFVYVEHAIPLRPTFSIDYDNTFFRSLELKGKKLRVPTGYGLMVTDEATLFFHRPDDYYEVTYREIDPTAYPLETVDGRLLSMVQDQVEFDKDQPEAYNNILIRYLIGKELDGDTINLIDQMSFYPNMQMFYAIPEIIFVLEQYIKTLLKR